MLVYSRNAEPASVEFMAHHLHVHVHVFRGRWASLAAVLCRHWWWRGQWCAVVVDWHGWRRRQGEVEECDIGIRGSCKANSIPRRLHS